MKLKSVIAAFALAGLGAGMTAALPASAAAAAPALQQVAKFGHQVTGVTVSETGRIFVNFPRWTEDAPVSVAEVMKDGSIKPYPDAGWNAWRNASGDEISPADHFVCVQSVVADGHGSVWVLDPAAPATQALVPGGPKLVRIDLATNKVAKVYAFDQSVAIPGSYLNDVRFSSDGKFAFMTDSGQRGALVVLELASGKAKRVLDGHSSTQIEKGVQVHTDGKELHYPDGRKVQFSADSIALAPDGWLYWKPLTGHKLYRIQASALESKGFAGQDVAGDVQPFGEVGISDGFWIGDKATKGNGNLLYVTSPETNAVSVRDLSQGPSGALRTVVQDARLRWPDTFGQGPDGTIYVTTSHIQDSAFFKKDAPPSLPTQLWKFKPAE
ncbi:L-dopachrome tautomerase-related protein [Massilia sp. 9096]|uniref:L-dopachrome tautomerase-related protein n=1 Tax=Massilia sp. 9096 TaxID=1500894 RepID=UPI000569BEFB|nr:L-dopachrome tautomerase-related protein [Massilia sp. 9096]